MLYANEIINIVNNFMKQGGEKMDSQGLVHPLTEFA